MYFWTREAIDREKKHKDEGGQHYGGEGGSGGLLPFTVKSTATIAEMLNTN